MGKHLRQHVTSSYFDAANKLRSKQARRKIVAYVESYDDVFFWRSILGRYEDDTRYFQVTLPTHDNQLTRGKKGAIMSMLSEQLGSSLIACVDADYDFLIQGSTETSRTVISNPFVLHTYAYAIENMQCYAPALHDICVMVTLNDTPIFNFRSFFEQFSRILFPLLVWSIWYYRTPRYNEFTITDFCRIIEPGKLSPDNAQATLQHLAQKVSTKIAWLQRKNPQAKESYLAVKADLIRLGVTPSNAYLYIQGHHLFNKMVLPLLDRVCQKLIQLREREIADTSKHGTQRHNELSSYNHSIANLEQMLKRNTGYLGSPQALRIFADVERLLSYKPNEGTSNSQ